MRILKREVNQSYKVMYTTYNGNFTENFVVYYSRLPHFYNYSKYRMLKVETFFSDPKFYVL